QVGCVTIALTEVAHACSLIEIRCRSDRFAHQKFHLKSDRLLGYKRTYIRAYLTNGGETPSAAAAELAAVQRVDVPNAAITDREAKWIQQLSKLAGKQSRSLTGLGLGFLSNFNVSLIFGADFAIGDNNTLMHLAQTIAEISSYRTTEYAAWKVLSSN
ncbi:MAG: hypothetical protein ACREBC_39260, partial [Pyrinomonadaceae bacterium]